MVRLTIDDHTIHVNEGYSILDVCREQDIYVPTLCYHPALEAYGACRLCIVEVSQPPRPSRLVAACVTPCEEGMVIWTDSEPVRHSRKITAELLLAGSPRNPTLLTLAHQMGVERVRFTLPEKDDCILCGLCVRACTEIVGVSAISLVNRGINKTVSAPFEISSSTCIGCGTCVLICPTGAIQLEDISKFHSIHPGQDEFQHIYCQICSDVDLQPHFVEDIQALMSKKMTYTG